VKFGDESSHDQHVREIAGSNAGHLNFGFVSQPLTRGE
jgi:hypothetical protein